MSLISLILWQTTHLQPFQDPPETRTANIDVVVPLKIHTDLPGTEMIGLPQIEDLGDNL